MSALFRKKSPLAKRLGRIEKELSSVTDDLRSFERGGRGKRKRAQTTAEQGKQPTAETAVPETAAKPHGAEKKHSRQERKKKGTGDTVQGRPYLRDERFADYLASSLHAARPLRHERRIQRNKAILMLVFVLLVLVWFAYQFFL